MKTPTFHTQADGSIVCRHRDVSCCDACATKIPHCYMIYGRHFFLPDPAGRAEVVTLLARGRDANGYLKKERA